MKQNTIDLSDYKTCGEPDCKRKASVLALMLDTKLGFAYCEIHDKERRHIRKAVLDSTWY